MSLGEMPFAFQTCDKINFYEVSVGWLGGRSIWRYGMPLSLRGDTAWTCPRNKATDAKKKKKRKEKYNKKTKVHTLTGAAAGTRGWHILDMQSPFLDKKVKDKRVKAKEGMIECGFCCCFVCVCVVDFSAASAPWQYLSVAKGPQPWPRISQRAVSTQHFPLPLVN